MSISEKYRVGWLSAILPLDKRTRMSLIRLTVLMLKFYTLREGGHTMALTREILCVAFIAAAFRISYVFRRCKHVSIQSLMHRDKLNCFTALAMQLQCNLLSCLRRLATTFAC